MKKPENLTIAIKECYIGKILVAQSSKGLHSVLIAQSKTDLLKNFEIEFPKTRLIYASKSLKETIDKICSFVDKPTKDLDYTLDMRGTYFQMKVWKALLRIPVGKTASYKDIADWVYHPNATRAVAMACGQNKLAIVIPCHRVIKSNGTLGGYRWGIDRKKILLDSERRYSEP